MPLYGTICKHRNKFIFFRWTFKAWKQTFFKISVHKQKITYQPGNYSLFLATNTTVSLVLQYIQTVNRTYYTQNTVWITPFICIHGYFASSLPPFQNSRQRETLKLKDLDNFPVSCLFIKHMLLPDFLENLSCNDHWICADYWPHHRDCTYWRDWILCIYIFNFHSPSNAKVQHFERLVNAIFKICPENAIKHRSCSLFII